MQTKSQNTKKRTKLYNMTEKVNAASDIWKKVENVKFEHTQALDI